MTDTLKYYEGVGYGTNLMDAIYDSAYSSNDPPLIHKWINIERKRYLEPEYDSLRLFNVLWDLQNPDLIVFLHKIGFPIDKMAEGTWIYKSNNYTLPPFFLNPIKNKQVSNIMIDRALFNYLRTLANDDEKKLIDVFERCFNIDLNGDRVKDSYEWGRQQYDEQICWIDKNEDQDVAGFFGIKINITAYKIMGEEYSPEEIFFCPDCEEANAWIDLEGGWDINEVDKGYYYCDSCGESEPIDDDFVKANKHIPISKIIACKV